MKFYYSVDTKEENPDNRFVFEDLWVYDENELWQAVNSIANEHYSMHDGWECWKNTTRLWFYLWNDNRQYLGRFFVQLECEPTFHSKKVPE